MMEVLGLAAVFVAMAIGTLAYNLPGILKNRNATKVEIEKEHTKQMELNLETAKLNVTLSRHIDI